MQHYPPHKPKDSDTGFTLIELSIVMVIIALIIGGILTGQDLIAAATIRAQLSQIEKYNTAVNTFRAKYGFLPGDIPNPYASNFGLPSRGQYAGEGDGNGVIEGVQFNGTGANVGTAESGGETVTFWVDLSQAGLIDGGFTTATPTTVPASNITLTSTPSVNAYFPQAKLGNGNYLYVYSYQSQNFFGLSGINYIGGGGGNMYATNGGDGSMTVLQASQIDNKVDDGRPLTGHVTAVFNNCCGSYGSGWLQYSTYLEYAGFAGAISQPSYTGSYSCYNNGGVAGVPPVYTLPQNSGLTTCGLSFQFQ